MQHRILALMLASCAGEAEPVAQDTAALTRGSPWRYWDRGGDLGTAWPAAAYDDAAWSTGIGPLGYGESYLATIVGYGPSASSKYVTTYMRGELQVADPAAVRTITGELMYDDGVVVFLNGHEIARLGLPTGTITAATFATGHEAKRRYETLDWTAHRDKLVAGVNTIAAEVHQQTASSSDLVFDLAVALEVAGPTTPPPDGGIPARSSWTFWDRGGDLGTAWREVDHEDATWRTGAGALGYGETYHATTIGFGGDPSRKHVTTYFRRMFTLDDASTVAAMHAALMLDDGAVFYLNGHEIARIALPTGTITATTLAAGYETGDAYRTFDWSAAISRLRPGTNVIAAEVHQQSTGSSDLTFDLGLELEHAAAGSIDAPWPGTDDVVALDAPGALGGNLSDLYFDTNALWTVDNGASSLIRLVPSGTTWTREPARRLRYPNGAGSPDAEGVTRAEPTSAAIYVSAERDPATSTASRLSILRYDPTVAGAELRATHEWNLTGDLPAVHPNLGLEALRWIPDTLVVARGFLDERTGNLYDPADYPGHGTGLFLVGVEATGAIHAYALDHTTGGFRRLASFASGLPHVMAIEVDRDVGYLWAHCDYGCDNQVALLDLGSDGRFTLRRRFARPSTLPNTDHEGFAVEPESACTSGRKPVYWIDDAATDGHALRTATVPCGAFVP